MRICSRCKQQPVASATGSYCKDCQREYSREWELKNKDRRSARKRQQYIENTEYFKARNKAYRKANPDIYKNSVLKYEYGITLEQFNEMFLAQGSKCAICKRTDPGSKKGWIVDHCHTTEQVRSILCNACNAMLGFSRDSVETHKAAIAYLNFYAHNPQGKSA